MAHREHGEGGEVGARWAVGAAGGGAREEISREGNEITDKGGRFYSYSGTNKYTTRVTNGSQPYGATTTIQLIPAITEGLANIGIRASGIVYLKPQAPTAEGCG